MGVIEKKGANLERNSNKGLPSGTSLGVNQNGKKVGTPRQFFEECENTGVRGYGTWKNLRNFVGRRFGGFCKSGEGEPVARSLKAWQGWSREFTTDANINSIKCQVHS
jgi:hypothetical protein